MDIQILIVDCKNVKPFQGISRFWRKCATWNLVKIRGGTLAGLEALRYAWNNALFPSRRIWPTVFQTDLRAIQAITINVCESWRTLKFNSVLFYNFKIQGLPDKWNPPHSLGDIAPECFLTPDRGVDNLIFFHPNNPFWDPLQKYDIDADGKAYCPFSPLDQSAELQDSFCFGVCTCPVLNQTRTEDLH